MPPLDPLVVAGAAAIAAAVLWRVLHRWRARHRLRRALKADDPGVRIAAVGVATARGLRPHARLLLRRARAETDPAVRAAFAAAISHQRWEPPDNAKLVALRLWAEENRDGAVPAVVRAPTRQRVDAAPRPDGSAPMTVLVTGAGGPAGVAVIRALRARGHHVVAGDADGTAVGLRLADVATVLPRADDPRFVESLVDVARRTSARVLLSTVAEEYTALITAGEALDDAGLARWLPPLETVEACIDKWRFACVLDPTDVPVPATNLASADGVPGPWIVKPRFGRGSRDVHRVDRRRDIGWCLRQVPDPLVQTRLDGHEFTVDVLVDRDGRLVGAVPRWRLETRAGISTKGCTFELDGLVEPLEGLLGALGVEGAANVQGFVTHAGEVVFVEVNPRFSGGLPLSLAAGSDLVGEYLRGILGESIRPHRLTYRPGVTMVRHYEEVFDG